MRRGKLMEPVILDAVREIHSDLGEVKFNRDYFYDPETGIGATPDAFAGDDDTVIELKNVRWGAFADGWKDAEAPVSHQLQLQCQMALTGRRRGVIFAFVGGENLHHYDYEFRPDVWAKVLQDVAAFHQLAASKTPPDDDRLPAETNAHWKQLAANPRQGEVDLSGNNQVQVLIKSLLEKQAQSMALSQQLRELKSAAKAIKVQLLDEHMGGGATAIAGKFFITSKLVHMPEKQVSAYDYLLLSVKNLESKGGEK